MEPFKAVYNEAYLQAMQARLDEVHGFGTAGTPPLTAAWPVLQTLEMKARAALVADHLVASIRARGAGSSVEVLDAVAALVVGNAAWTGFRIWPHFIVMESVGLDAPEEALAHIRQLTSQFTGEFAVRPFLLQHRALAWTHVQRWACDANEHVRRLASEGARPRLPWGQKIPWSVADPGPSLEILEILRDDPSAYVRRSVANHLNDISWFHPQVAVETASRWYASGDANRRQLVRHAMRTRIKAGDAQALAIFDAMPAQLASVSLDVAPTVVSLGDALVLRATLSSAAAHAQSLVLDYVLRYVRADGSYGERVFKGTQLPLEAGATTQWTRRHVMREVTTRRHYPGRHEVLLQVNGTRYASADFLLRRAEAAGETVADTEDR